MHLIFQNVLYDIVALAALWKCCLYFYSEFSSYARHLLSPGATFQVPCSRWKAFNYNVLVHVTWCSLMTGILCIPGWNMKCLVFKEYLCLSVIIVPHSNNVVSNVIATNIQMHLTSLLCKTSWLQSIEWGHCWVIRRARSCISLFSLHTAI